MGKALTPEQKARNVEHANRWAAANPEKAREYKARYKKSPRGREMNNARKRERRANDPEYAERCRQQDRETRARHNRRYRLERKYGMSLDAYQTLWDAQGGLCAICGRPETALSTLGVVQPLSVDHDHITGAVRGLLCAACNKSLGGFSDNPTYLRLAAEYLEGQPCR